MYICMYIIIPVVPVPMEKRRESNFKFKFGRENLLLELNFNVIQPN